jgi:glycosyltransferase involved in cell wall biosynthesis
MNRIRVRALYTKYPHIGSHSGFVQVLRHLDRAQVAVSARAVSDSDADWPLPETRLNGRLRRVGVDRGMAWYKLSDLAAELRVLPACLANSIDIVHYLDAEHTGQFLQTWIHGSRISRVKTIATFHQPPELLEGLINPDAVRKLDLAMAVAPSQVPFLQRFLPADRVVTVLHGIDTTFFRPGPDRPPRQAFRCITAGHWLRNWKAVRAVAERLTGWPEIECHVVTDRETGLEGLANVIFHRNIDDESLCRLYQQADVLLLPLINATANNTLLEALACGLPVISTRLPSITAYVDDRCATLVEQNDPAQLVRAIVGLREDGARRAAMARAARARAEALAWPGVAGRLTSIYRAVGSARSVDSGRDDG